MNKTRYAFMTALVLIAGLAGGAVSGGFSAVLPARAQRVDRSSGTVSNRWEYCSITRAAVGQGRGGLYWISYFREGGVQVVEVEEQATERGGPAKAIAKLGEEGWEMVGQGPLEIRQGGFNALYFKRPKP
ncbi:MAG: hypothetical protein ABR577_19080 [Pyrinomonadaceae bacterium]